MTFEEVIIVLVRSLGSLLFLKWAFVGAIIAILVDFSDLFMMNLLDFGGVQNYQSLDKFTDLVYMATFLVVALRWSGVVRNIAIALFVYRVVGVIVFEIVSWRGLLLFFPNVFEFWFLFVAGLNRFKPRYEITYRRAVIWLVPLLILKEFQEYVLHWGKWLDKYRAVDVAADWWNFVVGVL